MRVGRINTKHTRTVFSAQEAFRKTLYTVKRWGFVFVLSLYPFTSRVKYKSTDMVDTPCCIHSLESFLAVLMHGVGTYISVDEIFSSSLIIHQGKTKKITTVKEA